MCKKQITRHPFFLLLVTLIFTVVLSWLPSIVAADTYLKVPPATNYTYGTIYNSGNVRLTDDAFAYFRQYSVANGQHAIGNTGFAIGYTEDTFGYIQDIHFGMEYHMYPIAFSDDYLEGWYSDTGGSSWYSAFFPSGSRPIVNNTVVSATANDGSKDTIYTTAFNSQTRIDQWDELNGNIAGYGLYCDVCWYKINRTWRYDKTSPYVDYIFVNVLSKLTVWGQNKAPANATQGQTDITMLEFTLRPFSNATFDIDGIAVTFAGGSGIAWSDIATVKIYQDNDESGDVSAGDTLMGSSTVTGNPTTVSGTPLINDPQHNSKWLVAVDLSETATANAYFSCSLNDENSIIPRYDGTGSSPSDYHGIYDDGVASNADRTNIHTNATLDPNPLWPISSGNCYIRKRATLAASFTAPPTQTVTMGDNFTVSFRLANSGWAAAENVLPQAFIINSTGNGMAVTSNNQTPQTIAAGGNHTFTYTYTATGDGTLYFTGDADYTDATSGNAYTCTTSANSNTTTINYAAVPILQITSVTATPSTVSNDGQTITVTVNVKNAGNAQANNVGIYHPSTAVLGNLAISGTGTVSETSDDTGTYNLAAGATRAYVFTYTATGNGTAQFAVRANGSNVNPTDSNSGVVTIQRKAALAITSMITSPSGVVGKDATFTLLIDVTNSGEAAATLVAPALPTLSITTDGDPDPSVKSGPTPSNYATIAAGETKQFYYSYYSKCTNSLGKYKLATTINYKDGNSTSARSSASVQTALIDIQNTITPIAEKVTSNNVRKVIAYSVDAQYYIINDSNVIYAYNTAGIQKWSYDLTTLGITVPGYSIQTTTEGAYNVIWFGSNNGRVYAVKDNGTSAGGFWTSSIADSWVSLGHVKPVTTGPIVWNGFIYCGAGERLAKRTVSNRSIPSGWTDYDLPNDITTIPSLDNTYIYVGCKNGRLYSIREGTGGLQSQSAATGGEIHSDPFVWAGKIYTGNYQGELYRFNDTTDLTDFNMVDLDGGTNGQLSGVWVGFGLDFIWVTDKAGGNLYKRAYADLSSSATYNKAGETLYDPIEWAGKVYFGAATGGGTGKMYAVNKTDGSNVNLWPYLESDPFTSPAALDPFNNVFLSGCDNNNLYMFSLPQ